MTLSRTTPLRAEPSRTRDWIDRSRKPLARNERPAPSGYCECGCGGKTRIPTHTDRWAGQAKGVPLRFIYGHSGRPRRERASKGSVERCRCVICATEFDYRVVSAGFLRKTCSPKCQSAYRRQRAGERPPRPWTRFDLKCEGCGRTWTYAKPPSTSYLPKACSPQCRADLKRRGNGDRRGRRNPAYKKGDRVGWHEWIATREDLCAVCGRSRTGVGKKNSGRLEIHHAIYDQHIRAAGGNRYDTRAGMTVCARCHKRHHLRSVVIPLVVVPDAVFGFASELFGAEGAYEYLRRYYAGEDPRLEGLLVQAELSGTR